MKLIDLTGQRFGRLVVIERAESSKSGKIRWLCRCDCGKQKVVDKYCLTKGWTQSCGCLQAESRYGRRTTHGGTETTLYQKWAGMKRRCYNKHEKAYKYYGGRGISVCEEWKKSFIAFRTWALNNGYDYDKILSLELDRIDVNGNYCPENCRWVTRKEQANNKRNNRFLTLNGETHTMAEWSEITGLSTACICLRLNRYKWSVEDALTKTSKVKEK